MTKISTLTAADLFRDDEPSKGSRLDADFAESFKTDARQDFGSHLCVECQKQGINRFGPYGTKLKRGYIWHCREHR